MEQPEQPTLPPSGVPQAAAGSPDNQGGDAASAPSASTGPEAATASPGVADGPEESQDGQGEPQDGYMPFETPMPAGVPPELATRVDRLAPRRPPEVRSAEQIERWELCARTAVLSALSVLGDEAEDRDVREWAWHAARAAYRSDVKTGKPEAPPE